MKELLEQLGFKDDNGVYLPTRTEFDDALDKHFGVAFVDDANFRVYCRRYREFVKQLLALWMFIPCDDNGEVLEKPKEDNSKYWVDKGVFRNAVFNADLEQYQQAEERVLFKVVICGDDSFSPSYFYNGYSHLYETIEQAINNGVKLYLK